jgi:hypothetical protein
MDGDFELDCVFNGRPSPLRTAKPGNHPTASYVNSVRALISCCCLLTRTRRTAITGAWGSHVG